LARIGIDNGKHVDRDARPETVTRLTERLGKYRIFSRPESADQLWLELETDSPYPDICIHITLAWRDANFAAVREECVVLNRLGQGPLSVVLEVPCGCEDLWAGFNVAHSGVGVDLNWLRLRWTDGAGAAVLPGGASVPEGSPDGMADAAVGAITTILSNYDAYRGSCEWLARQWAGAQNADQLVSGILEAPVLSRQRRFSGGDW
jgi:hypothetical protein